MRTEPSRFDRVVAHPEYASAPDQPVLPADATIGIAETIAPLTLTVFGLVFLLIAIELAGSSPIALVGIGFAVLLMLAGIKLSAQLVRQRNAPIERLIAVIVKERADVSGDSGSATTYFTTLQTRAGARSEYETCRSLVGRLAVDDIGVAYVKARSLVEFIRFDVE